MFDEYHHETTSAVSWEGMYKLWRLTHYHRKTTVTAFANGAGEYFLNILPRSPSMDIGHFAVEIIG
jgi:hypothetical protein